MKKGFTLVELLAVIVILAIVALITTPAILNVIDKSRKSGAENKAWGTMKAVEYAYTQSQYKGNTVVSLPHTFKFKTDTSIGGVEVKMSGERPSEGTVTIGADGKLSSIGLKFDKQGTYYCTSNTVGTKMCCSKGTNQYDTNAKCDNDSGSSGGSEPTLTIDQTFVPQYYEYNTGYTVWIEESFDNTYDLTEWTKDPTTLNRNFYLGHDANSATGEVTANYECFILTDASSNKTQYCLKESPNGVAWPTNKSLLTTLKNNGAITCSIFNDYDIRCGGSGMNVIGAGNYGNVYAGDSLSTTCGASTDNNGPNNSAREYAYCD